ncbi:hypothetical protein BJ170DRAFT_277294 [Xylariales sp. AK1849]|nr:hypothetical protein BJ170DRAFT_277294 [Xylariales sp. AK1849]
MWKASEMLLVHRCRIIHCCLLNSGIGDRIGVGTFFHGRSILSAVMNSQRVGLDYGLGKRKCELESLLRRPCQIKVAANAIPTVRLIIGGGHHIVDASGPLRARACSQYFESWFPQTANEIPRASSQIEARLINLSLHTLCAQLLLSLHSRDLPCALLKVRFRIRHWRLSRLLLATSRGKRRTELIYPPRPNALLQPRAFSAFQQQVGRWQAGVKQIIITKKSPRVARDLLHELGTYHTLVHFQSLKWSTVCLSGRLALRVSLLPKCNPLQWFFLHPPRKKPILLALIGCVVDISSKAYRTVAIPPTSSEGNPCAASDASRIKAPRGVFCCRLPALYFSRHGMFPRSNFMMPGAAVG